MSNIIYDKKKYKDYLLSEELLQRYENEYGIKFLFGGAYGTKVYGTGNALSDIDFKFVHLEESENAPGRKHMFDVATMNDIISIDIDCLKKEINNYMTEQTHWPSVLYRKSEEQSPFDLKRSDYYLSYVFEILGSDYIYGVEYLRSSLSDILSYINVKAVCDYYYTRAFMHFKKSIEPSYNRGEKCEVKAVLATFVNINIINSLINENKIITPNIYYFAEKNRNISVKELIGTCLSLQAQIKNERDTIGKYHTFNTETQDFFRLDVTSLKDAKSLNQKPKIKIEINEGYKKWAFDELDRLAKEISGLDTNIKLGLGEDTFLSQNL